MDTTVFLFEKFIEIEEKYNFFDIYIGNVKIWQYIRFTFCSEILKKLTGISITNTRTLGITNWKKRKYSKYSYFKKRQFLLHRKDLLIVNHPRRVKLGKVYRCYVTEALLEYLPYSYYVFEDEYKGEHFAPIATKGLKYRNISVLEKIFSYDPLQYKEEIRSKVDKIIKIFEYEFSILFDNNTKMILNQICRSTLSNIFYGKRHAEIILKLIRPKLVIVTVAYKVSNQVLIETAKNMGIPTIELQHGRIGESHVAYNFKKIRNLETFPDYIFTYGNYEKEIPRYPISRKHVLAVGYPELELRADYYRNYRKKQKYKVVTFISSPIEGEVISKYAIDFAKVFEGSNIKIIYKLHPAEYSNWKCYYNYQQFRDLNIHVVCNNKHDIYYYLGHSDYIIGISSTVLFEATQFDVKIIIIKELDYLKCEAIYNNGCGVAISNLQELVDVVKNKKDEQKNNLNKDFYFTKNSIQCMKSAIDNILNGNI